MTEPMHALVTGANKGLGLEIARGLARRGCVVWLGARNARLGQQAAETFEQSHQVRFLRLDVADDEEVREAARTITFETGRLDILVNNAGVSLDQGAPPSRVDITRVQRTLEVNVLGPVRVTQAMLPLLTAAPAGRIVMMGSGLGSLTRQSDPENPFFATNALAYALSKAALSAVTISFAKELARTRVKINAADPGFTATDLNANRGTRTVAQGAAIALHLATLADDGPTGGFFEDAGRVPW